MGLREEYRALPCGYQEGEQLNTGEKNVCVHFTIITGVDGADGAVSVNLSDPSRAEG